MALVAVAGPLTNFLLAFICFLIGWLTGALQTTDSGVVGYIFAQGVMINLGFFLFNLIPIQPLDGSRILYAIAPDGARRVMENLEKYGLIIVLLLVMVFSSTLSRFLVGGMNGILDFFYFLVGA